MRQLSHNGLGELHDMAQHRARCDALRTSRCLRCQIPNTSLDPPNKLWLVDPVAQPHLLQLLSTCLGLLTLWLHVTWHINHLSTKDFQEDNGYRTNVLLLGWRCILVVEYWVPGCVWQPNKWCELREAERRRAEASGGERAGASAGRSMRHNNHKADEEREM